MFPWEKKFLIYSEQRPNYYLTFKKALNLSTTPYQWSIEEKDGFINFLDTKNKEYLNLSNSAVGFGKYNPKSNATIKFVTPVDLGNAWKCISYQSLELFPCPYCDKINFTEHALWNHCPRNHCDENVLVIFLIFNNNLESLHNLQTKKKI
jgi:hypothetical protein